MFLLPNLSVSRAPSISRRSLNFFFAQQVQRHGCSGAAAESEATGGGLGTWLTECVSSCPGAFLTLSSFAPGTAARGG